MADRSYIPPRPTGDDEEARYHQAVYDRVFGGKFPFVDTPQCKVSRAPNGYTIHVAPARGGGGGVTVFRGRLKVVTDDYLACVSWDGTAEGADQVLIAKTPKLRHSITTETIEGIRYDYTYLTGPDALNKYRVAKIHGTTDEYERCVVTPEWLLNDDIYALPADTGVEGVSLLLLNDGRAWAVHA